MALRGMNFYTGFAEATNAAKNASQVLVILGLDQSIEAEFRDRSSIELPGHQGTCIGSFRQFGSEA